ncbi:MAG: hypothetical protein QGD94_00140 [Planctomycetia bacterium]|nr:hypothetical protein [Planctomycetia bacterium]
MRKPTVSGMIVLAAGLFFAWLPSCNDEDRRTMVTNPVRYQCEECGNGFASEPAVTPLECPKCGESSAHRAFRCKDCGHVFTAHLPDALRKWAIAEGKTPPAPKVEACPKCGSSAIQSEWED